MKFKKINMIGLFLSNQKFEWRNLLESNIKKASSFIFYKFI